MESKLRTLGYIEGLSFLLLLFAAMPMKYLAGEPIYVRWVGMAHGGLFILFVLLAFYVSFEKDWDLKRLMLALVSSVLPFGPFLLDKRIYKR